MPKDDELPIFGQEHIDLSTDTSWPPNDALMSTTWNHLDFDFSNQISGNAAPSYQVPFFQTVDHMGIETNHQSSSTVATSYSVAAGGTTSLSTLHVGFSISNPPSTVPSPHNLSFSFPVSSALNASKGASFPSSSSSVPVPPNSSFVSSNNKIKTQADIHNLIYGTPDPDANVNATPINEEDKRRRNTAASARFRLKKKEREAELERYIREAQVRYEALQRRASALETENRWLRELITERSRNRGKRKSGSASSDNSNSGDTDMLLNMITGTSYSGVEGVGSKSKPRSDVKLTKAGDKAKAKQKADAGDDESNDDENQEIERNKQVEISKTDIS